MQTEPANRCTPDTMTKTGEGYSLKWSFRGTPPERGTFFRLQVYERERNSITEVYERIGKSVIAVCENTQ